LDQSSDFASGSSGPYFDSNQYYVFSDMDVGGLDQKPAAKKIPGGVFSPNMEALCIMA
jgi:hypothetical protein